MWAVRYTDRPYMWTTTQYYAEQVKFHLAPVISKRLDEYFSAVAISNFVFDYKRSCGVFPMIMRLLLNTNPYYKWSRFKKRITFQELHVFVINKLGVATVRNYLPLPATCVRLVSFGAWAWGIWPFHVFN